MKLFMSLKAEQRVMYTYPVGIAIILDSDQITNSQEVVCDCETQQASSTSVLGQLRYVQQSWFIKRSWPPKGTF